MKKNFFFPITFFLFFSGLSAQNTATKEDSIIVDRSKYTDYTPLPKPSNEQKQFYQSILKHSRSIGETRPRKVNNGTDGFFPPIFNQDGGSCGSASAIGYQFTHEINSYRNVNGSLPENIYPTHFTWLLTYHNSGKEEMAMANGIPNSVVYGGKTYSGLFGSQTYEDLFGWMQGYDKWYSAMFNRMKGSSSIGSLEYEENREILKQWLWNHWGDTSFHSGGVAGFGVGISGCTTATIPAGSYEAGKYYIKYWGPGYDHAMTFVGYDDDIEIDLNEDGTIQEDEKGAWIIANSWSDGWCNNGFVYCPYKNARITYNPETKVWGSWITAGVEHIRKDYVPKRTIKISMNYTIRNQIMLSAGISEDTSATKPEKTVDMHHFKYAGNEAPMLGRWKNGMHYESMKFGYDLTDLSAYSDQTKPLKYFFIVSTKTGSTGVGTIDSCAIMNYELDESGLEIPFSSRNVEILNNGQQTILSVVVPGTPLNKPTNLSLAKNSENRISLEWSAPEMSVFSLKGYRVYRQGILLADNLPVSNTTFSDDNSPEGSSYQVSALYSINGKVKESGLSEKVLREIVIEDSHAVKFSNGGFIIPEVFNQPLTKFTIEFWAKPSVVTNWNWHIGPGWGTFLMHFNSDKTICVGYSTSERFYGGSINTNQWSHIAIVVNGPTISLYVNGLLAGSKMFANRNGISNISNFYVGNTGLGAGIQGEIDEFRVWNTARTRAQINNVKGSEIANPSREVNLIGYYKMDTISGKLVDCKGNNHADFVSSDHTMTTQTAVSGSSSLTEVMAGFELPVEGLYPGKVLPLINTSSNGATSFVWNAPEGGLVNKGLANPTVCFEKPGTYDITLIALNSQKADTMTQQIVIEPLPLPKADFAPSFSGVSVDEKIGFINLTKGDFCEYHWYFDGGTPAEATGLHAYTTYSQSGKHTVRLVATNPSGKDSLVREHAVDVLNIIPTADFEADKHSILTGEKVQLTDKSVNEPSAWKWIIEGEQTKILTEQNPSVVFSKPGTYSVTLIVENKAGINQITNTNLITVTNPGGGNALNFDGVNDYVQIDDIFKESPLKEFTIEWWMSPSENTTDGQQMGDASGTILMQTTTDGKLRVLFDNSNQMLSPSILTIGEWSHYAFVFDNGKGTIYKNGVKVTSKTFTLKEVPKWINGFRIGCDNAKTIRGTVDEFRIWSVARTAAQLIETISAPIENPDAYSGLELYYRFDQNTGNVEDVMKKHTGSRMNFGPDGDAWVGSGAFNLSVDATKIETTVREYNTTSVIITCSKGLGTKRIVFIKKANESDGYPTDKEIYTASTEWTAPGGKLEGSGYYCVGNSTSTEYSVTGLEPFTDYEVMVVEYLIENQLPVYFKTASHAFFTTGAITDETKVSDRGTTIIQTASSIEIHLNNAGKHSLSFVNMLGKTAFQITEDNNHFSVSKESLKENFYILDIDHVESHKIFIIH
ncbi:MAG: PKD domain-containing protein [Bacteroidales bacterium]|nr:PKD domain-containing protein [Bacteroidales bacterium]